MRLHGKLVLMVALFAGLASTTGRRMSGELVYEARVAFVVAFGTESDFGALIDDTQHMLAAQNGGIDLYHAGQRYQQLIAERLTEAARLNVPLTEDDLFRIRAECARKAFGKHGPSIGHGAVTTLVTAGPLAQESTARLSRPRPGAQSSR